MPKGQQAKIQAKTMEMKSQKRRCILWARTVIRVLSTLILLLIGLVMYMNIEKMNVNNEKIKIYQSLDTMISIDNFIHQKFNEVSQLHNPRTAEMDAKFPELDYQYHYAKSLKEKYQAAKQFVDFLISWEQLLKSMGYTKAADEETFSGLVNAFNKIQIK